MHAMDQRLHEAERLIDEYIASTDVECLSAGALRDVAAGMDRITRKTSGFGTLVVGEVARKGAWNDGKSRSAEDWVARTTGAGWGEAKDRITLGSELRALPTTTEALLEGRISGSQAALVARAASVDPHAEYRMLDLAGRASHTELRDASRRVVASASGQLADEQAAVHRTRYLKTWTDRDGAFRIDARLTKADGAKVLAVLEPLMEVEFADARRQGRRESPDAYRADALVTMAERATSGSDQGGPSATVVVRVDHAALLRGHVEGDEVSEVVGIGPVPVAEVERFMGDPILKILLTKGEEVTAVSTMTRVVRSTLRAAVVERDRVCVVPTCGIAHGLEIDHLIPFAQGGPTSIDNLQRLCKHHHRLKTAGKAKLTRWETPDGPQFGWLPLTEEGCEPVGHTDRTGDRTGDRTTERVSAGGGRTGAAGGEPERTLWTA